ncbi:hypothetical protein SODALDRAFT_377406 [Sodiomyces alkalinus F11]|uniref:Transcription factor TFIIIC triple barrel domain-containing protein n=1 Tax=Sodiomyces alkalinus (strain CBS 110278 / VKM F-3762 / F11) TaxID=1314773 RepID=A0A3N2Q4S1_SODAK|nr:hypothetical protein SODALDRAFT_377406 [Sodiomyces alkalinus F11]ROT41752.1 hypothetical protein SODALDRAFT_377406 [Sodiomyces alkalinus F11]
MDEGALDVIVPSTEHRLHTNASPTKRFELFWANFGSRTHTTIRMDEPSSSGPMEFDPPNTTSLFATTSLVPGANSTTSPNIAPLPASSVPPPTECDDEDEWVYEYSNTETEYPDKLQTYYLTVDFSIPEFSQRPRRVPVSSRGGHQMKNWLNTGSRKVPEMTHHRIDSDDDEDNADDVHLPEPEDEEDEEAAGQQIPGQQGKSPQPGIPNSGKKPEEEEPPKGPQEDLQADDEEIQILDLHSEHPIFHYRNRVFEGSWARVLGTELLFTEQTSPYDKRRLPSLRTLPGDVDLLAASWSRIVATEKKLVPKQSAEAQQPEHDRFHEIKRAQGIRIPIWSDKTGERAGQTRFLEDLMAVKVKKGEKDRVTVYAQGPVDDERKMGTTRRRRAPWRGGRPRTRGLGWDAGLSGDERKRRRPLPDSRPGDAAVGRGSKRARGSERGRSRGLGWIAAMRGGPAEATLEEGFEDVSTPTPEKWADLEESGVVEAEYDGHMEEDTARNYSRHRRAFGRDEDVEDIDDEDDDNDDDDDDDDDEDDYEDEESYEDDVEMTGMGR